MTSSRRMKRQHTELDSVKSTMFTAPPQEPSPKSLAILEAAERLFVRYGYHKSSMEDVAREAGIAKGTVYLYYPGKEALFRALLERIGVTVLDAAREAANAPQPFGERLFGVLNAFYGYVHERYSESGHLQELGEIRGSLGQDLSEQLRHNHLQLLISLLQRAETEGDIELSARGVTAEEVATTLIAAAIGSKTVQPKGAGLKAYADALQCSSRVIVSALAKGK